MKPSKWCTSATALSSALTLTVLMANGPSYTTAIKEKVKGKAYNARQVFTAMSGLRQRLNRLGTRLIRLHSDARSSLAYKLRYDIVVLAGITKQHLLLYSHVCEARAAIGGYGLPQSRYHAHPAALSSGTKSKRADAQPRQAQDGQ